MTNMLPQAPDQNQGPWANMEQALRDIAGTGKETYIVMGGHGIGGTGDNGFKETIADGHVSVPNVTWKVVLVLAQGTDDVNRVTGTTNHRCNNAQPNTSMDQTLEMTIGRTTSCQLIRLKSDEVMTSFRMSQTRLKMASRRVSMAAIPRARPVNQADEDNSVNITLTAASPWWRADIHNCEWSNAWTAHRE